MTRRFGAEAQRRAVGLVRERAPCVGLACPLLDRVGGVVDRLGGLPAASDRIPHQREREAAVGGQVVDVDHLEVGARASQVAAFQCDDRVDDRRARVVVPIEQREVRGHGIEDGSRPAVDDEVEREGTVAARQRALQCRSRRARLANQRAASIWDRAVASAPASARSGRSVYWSMQKQSGKPSTRERKHSSAARPASVPAATASEHPVTVAASVTVTYLEIEICVRNARALCGRRASARCTRDVWL